MTNAAPDSSLTDQHPWLADGFMTTVEAADVLRGVIPLHVRQWCQAGLVRYAKEPTSRRYLVCVADIRAIAAHCDGLRPTIAKLRGLKERRGLGA